VGFGLSEEAINIYVHSSKFVDTTSTSTSTSSVFISDEILQKILLYSNIHGNENRTSDDNSEEITMIGLKGFIGGDGLFGFPGNRKSLYIWEENS